MAILVCLQTPDKKHNGSISVTYQRVIHILLIYEVTVHKDLYLSWTSAWIHIFLLFCNLKLILFLLNIENRSQNSSFWLSWWGQICMLYSKPGVLCMLYMHVWHAQPCDYISCHVIYICVSHSTYITHKHELLWIIWTIFNIYFHRTSLYNTLCMIIFCFTKPHFGILIWRSSQKSRMSNDNSWVLL